MIGIIETMKDPYERKARLVPGLLVALPLLVPLVCVYGPQHPALTSLMGLFGGCGALYWLANIARGQGKKLENKLVRNWGGMPTTIMLRHRDSTLDHVSKKGYHDAIAEKLGIEMPSAEAEDADPARADGIYTGATRRIRELTREHGSLLLKENIAYGYHRNMLAMKWVGIVTCLLGLGYGLVIAQAVQLSPFIFFPEKLADPGLAAALTLLVSVALLLAWLTYFTKDTVRQFGDIYAERLFECLHTLPSAQKRPPTRKPAAPETT